MATKVASVCRRQRYSAEGARRSNHGYVDEDTMLPLCLTQGRAAEMASWTLRNIRPLVMDGTRLTPAVGFHRPLRASSIDYATLLWLWYRGIIWPPFLFFGAAFWAIRLAAQFALFDMRLWQSKLILRRLGFCPCPRRGYRRQIGKCRLLAALGRKHSGGAQLAWLGPSSIGPAQRTCNPH